MDSRLASWNDGATKSAITDLVARVSEEGGPDLRTQQPYQAAYEGDLHWLVGAVVKRYHGDDSHMKLLMVAVPKAFEAVTVETMTGGSRSSPARPTIPGSSGRIGTAVTG
jgi:hypothetical protein